MALRSFCQCKSDFERSEWHLSYPHTKSLGSLQALRLCNILGRTVWYAEVSLWDVGPWIFTPILPLTGCVTLDKLLSWALVSPL